MKTQEIGKNRQIGLYQTKQLCIAKETRVERQHIEGEKIFENYNLDIR
jgi:hypothetical protein